MQLLLNSIRQALLDDVAASTTTSDAFATPARASYFTWQTSFGVAPSGINITIEGSLDNSSWSVIDTSTSTAGEVRSFTSSMLFVRAKINSATGGSGVTVSLVAKPYTVIDQLVSGATAWDNGTTYISGQVVLDRGGIWQATGSNLNEQPAPDNSYWTLIGGNPYIDISLSGADLIATYVTPATITTPKSGFMLVPTLISARYSAGLYPYTSVSSPAGPFLLYGAYSAPELFYIEGANIGSPSSSPFENLIGLGLVDTMVVASPFNLYSQWPTPSFFNGAPFKLSISTDASVTGVPNSTSINDAGLGYTAGDQVVDSLNGSFQITIDTVDGITGAVLTYHVTARGDFVYTAGDTIEMEGGLTGSGFIVNVDSVHLGDGTLTVRTYYQIVNV